MALQKALMEKNQLRILDQEDEQIPVIPTGCVTLDWMTDCGGFPRGRIIEVAGPESSGKCVTLDSLVPMPGKGLLTLEEVIRDLPWQRDEQGKIQPEATVKADFKLYGLREEFDGNGAYYAGSVETYQVKTERGHNLRGTPDHRVLTLPENGVLRWAHLKDLRTGDLLVTATAHKAEGTLEEICSLSMPSNDPQEPQHQEKVNNAKLLGALCMAEERSEKYHLFSPSRSQVKLVEDWAHHLIGKGSPFDLQQRAFAGFCGIVRLSEEWQTLAEYAIRLAPDQIRKASITAQKAFIAGATLLRGTWTGDDLEFEIADEKAAKVLHSLMENVGIRTIIYSCLNSFGNLRTKLALYDRMAQQAAHAEVWETAEIPPSWKGNYVTEQDELHPWVRKVLERAQIIYQKGKQKQAAGNLSEAVSEGGVTTLLASTPVTLEEIDLEDTEKDNLRKVASLIRPFVRTQTDERVYDTLIFLSTEYAGLDRVTVAEKSTEAPVADLSVPIGNSYVTNGLVSHNSTLCMHLCNKELERDPNAVVVYQDFEHSTATKYARKMGLHRHKNADGLQRFHLLPADMFEEADELFKQYCKHGVFPTIWVCDSVPAMVPSAMFERETDENPQVALQARLMSDLLSRWVKMASEYGTTFILINQVRAFIATGFMDKGKAVPGIAGTDKETTPGGNALKFYASMRLDLRPKSVIKAKIFNPMTGETEDIPVANQVKATARKNKVGAPYRSGMFYITFGEGIDTPRTMMDLAIKKNIIRKVTGGLELRISDTEVIHVRGQMEMLEALKRGTLASRAQEYLAEVLDWNRADEVTNSILGMVSEDVDSGDLSEDTAFSVEGTRALLEMVRGLNDTTMIAETLGVIKKDGRAFSWVNPNTGKEERGGRLDSLSKKIKGGDLTVLKSQCDARIKELEDSLQPAPETPQLASSDGAQSTGSVASPPTLEELMGETAPNAGTDTEPTES